MFAPLNAHLGFRPSMAGELESAAYALLSLAGVEMPWVQHDVASALHLWCQSPDAFEVAMMQAKVSWQLGLQSQFHHWPVLPSHQLTLPCKTRATDLQGLTLQV